MYKECDNLIWIQTKVKRSFREQVLDPSRKAEHSYNLVDGPGNSRKQKKSLFRNRSVGGKIKPPFSRWVFRSNTFVLLKGGRKETG